MYLQKQTESWKLLAVLSTPLAPCVSLDQSCCSPARFFMPTAALSGREMPVPIYVFLSQLSPQTSLGILPSAPFGSCRDAFKASLLSVKTPPETPCLLSAKEFTLRQGFGLAVETPTHISVPGFESRLCSRFQLPSNAHPPSQRVMVQGIGFLLPTWET